MGDRNLSGYSKCRKAAQAVVIALPANALRNDYVMQYPHTSPRFVYYWRDSDSPYGFVTDSGNNNQFAHSWPIVYFAPPSQERLSLFILAYVMTGPGRRAAVWCSIQLPYVGHNTIVALSVSNASIQIHRMTFWYILPGESGPIIAVDIKPLTLP
jgi:hypothetical protein